MRIAAWLILGVAACGGGGGATDGGGDGGGSGDPLDPAIMPPVDTDPSHYPQDVWVTDAMAKVQPVGTSPGLDHWALPWAAKNEVEGFQVHVRAGATPVELTVTVSDLVDAVSGTHIRADGDIVVYREAYLDITTRSDANGTYGLVPDGLIPAVDPYRGEARDAFPVTVPATETRSAWIDVHVPADAPSGWYTGTVTVDDGGSELASLPVRLAVWDFALPSTATLPTGFGVSWNGMCVQAYGGYAGCGAFPGAGGDADRGVELTHLDQAILFLDHRVSLAGTVYYAPASGSWADFDALYGPLMDGTAATRLDGARLTHLWYTGDLGDSAMLARWTDHFRDQGWLDRTSAYFCDEPPNGCSWSETQSRADLIQAAAPDLATLLTTDIANATAHDLLDRVDILVAIVESMENRDMASVRGDYDGWLAQPGKQLWWYQSCDEHESCSNGSPGPATATWPSYMVDASPMRNRVFQWLAYLYDIHGELYYAADYCWEASCGSGTNDPWVSQYAFGGNGDGTLFYPGTPDKIGGTTPVPVPSIRLLLLRDGMEDYEYLHALDAAGEPAAARAAATSFIDSTYSFDDTPAGLIAARKSLGDALHTLAHP